MSFDAWGLIALGGLAVVAAANLLRFRRTGNRSCLGQVFVPSEQMNRAEWVLNRLGMALFAGGVVAGLVL